MYSPSQTEYEAEMELFKVQKASLMSRIDELESKNKSLEETNDSISVAMEEMESELTDLKKKLSERSNTRTSSKDLDLLFDKKMELLRDQIREDLVQLAEQLYTNITDEVTKHKSAAEVTNIDKINIINGKVMHNFS